MTGLIGYAMIAFGLMLMCITPLQAMMLHRPRERIVKALPMLPVAFPIAQPEPSLEELVKLADEALERRSPRTVPKT